MKSAALASFLFAGAALAVPVAEKRGYQTDVVVTTVWTTTTIFVDGPTGAGFFEKARRTSSSSSASSSSSVASSSSSSSSSSSAAPSAPAPSAPAPVIAAASAVAPSEAPVAAPSVAAPSVAAPAPVAAAPASGSGSGPSGTGDVTFYTVNGNPGSCGSQKSDGDAVVALSHLTMNNGGNSNKNPLCGQTINIQGETQVYQAVVYDTCEGCAASAIDLSPSLFLAAFPHGDGRVHNVKWWVG